jgi:indolepyruvate ferredoxin oxidoreductase beta subunit
LLPNQIAIDADAIAKQAGSSRSSNIVMLGAASPFIDIPFERLEDGIRQLFGKKGEELVNTNLKALKAGRDFTEKNR